MSQTGLQKVTITPYKDKRLEDKDRDSGAFVLPINPESYTENLKVEYEQKRGQGNQGTAPNYTASSPKELKLDFVLDGTQTVENYHQELKMLPVAGQIKKLLQTVYLINGETHVPNRLKISWGKHLVFDCVLSSLDINYTLFNQDGTPLRAKLSATFLNYKEEEKRVREENKNSPDLTHVFQLKGGETLPQRAYEIYKSTDYYRQVALANDLTSFRNVREGSTLIYPPVKKSTTVE